MLGGWVIDSSAEDVGGERKCGELELLLAAEAPDESALAHPERVGETADGEALKTDDGGELDGGIE